MSWRKFALLALLIVILAPVLAWATGSLSIPNIIANQSGPTVQASLFDANWNAVRDYINNREITIGTLAARPAAGTAGRYYLASDTNGGTLYVDNSASWVQASAGVSEGNGVYSVRGLVAGTASATVINASATLVNLRNPSTGAVTSQRATATATNTITAAGPVANGQDQAGAFTASSFVHLYYIWNGSALATLSSACAPRDVNGPCSSVGGPNLPTGYTHWAYIGYFRLQANGALLPAFARGSWFTYASRTLVAASQTQVTSTGITIATAIATNTTTARIGFSAYHQNNGGGASDTSLVFGVTSAAAGFEVVEAARMRVGAGADNRAGQSGQVAIPNVEQGLFYRWTSNTNSSAQSADVFVEGYQVPNGGS